MLSVMEESLEELLQSQNNSLTTKDRISLFKLKTGTTAFTRKEYLRHNKDISAATASRDLKNAVEKKILKKTGDKRTSLYQFKA